MQIRRSHRRCSIKKDVLTNFTKFTGKHLCQCLFFNKVAGLRPATLLKKRLWHRCFSVNFVKFLRKPFSQNISGRKMPDMPKTKKQDGCGTLKGLLFLGVFKLSVKDASGYDAEIDYCRRNGPNYYISINLKYIEIVWKKQNVKNLFCT